MLPFTRRHRIVAARIPAEIDLGDVIDADTAGDVEDAGSDILGAVVDDVSSAACPGALGLFVRADRGDNRGACPGRELYGVMSDRTRTAGDEQCLALHRPRDKDRAMRGHRRHAEGRALGKGHVNGKFGHQIDGKRDVLRCGTHPPAVALPVVEPHPLAQPTLVYAGSDLVHDAGAIAVGDDPRIFHRRRAAAPVSVRWVDAGCLELHPHIAVPGLRRRQLSAHENLVRCSLAIVPNRSHRPLPKVCGALY